MPTETFQEYSDRALVAEMRRRSNPYCHPRDTEGPLYVLIFEDADRGHHTFEDESMAVLAFAKAEAGGWNCHLFTSAKRRSKGETMNAPTNMQEYLRRFQESQKVEGRGVGNVTVSAPCPFCAAPDFMKYNLLQSREAMVEDHTCAECGRSSKALLEERQGHTAIEIVQTGGTDQPDWLEPQMRRLEPGALK